MKHNVLIVDDESLARRGVALRLKPHTDFQVIGECTNGNEASDFIRDHGPDLVFLDIQMPMMNGIDVVRALPPGAQPFIIFLTAFDHYVMSAFEVHAIDYLLKPVDDARFMASLNHARRVLRANSAPEYNERLKRLLDKKPVLAQEKVSELTVRIGKQTLFVAVDEIDWIEAQDDYVEIHVGTRAHLIRESLNILEGRLDASVFLRIHRSAIVPIDRIITVTSLPNRDCAITLRNGTSLRVSRTYSDHLRKLLRERTLG